ncbi:MAG: hypothetical protein P8J90_01645 [Luminiphilus sp.]|nr:hypothetical protein [Luminiphilus sp.]
MKPHKLPPLTEITALLTALVLFFGGTTSAAANDKSGWSNQALIYILAPTLDGTSGIGPFDTEVDMDAADVFDALDGAFLGAYRGEGERFGIQLDIVSMDLKMDGEGDRGALAGEVKVEQTTVITTASWRLNKEFRLLGGALFNDLSTGVSLTGPSGTRQQSAGDDWVDPIVGVAYETPRGAHWDFSGSALVGGFGVGSESVVVLTGSFAYRFNHWSSLTLGYRYLDFDYEDGEGADRFKFNMKQYGPAVGVRFDF